MAYKNGDVVNANDINKAIDDSATAVNTANGIDSKATRAERNSNGALHVADRAVAAANTAKAASDKASADVVDLAQQIGTKQGTTVTVGGVAQNAVAFTSDPQTQIDELAPKNNPTLTNATLNGNTTIGNISNAEINALRGIRGGIQGQLDNFWSGVNYAYNYGGGGIIYNNIGGVRLYVELSVIEVGTDKFLYAVGTKQQGIEHDIRIIASNTLGLGIANNQGTQTIIGYTNGGNVKMMCRYKIVKIN